MSSQNVISYLCVLLAGIMIPPAVALNATLGRYLKSPILSALAVMLAGGFFVAILTASMRQQPPPAEEIAQIPWYVWLGGVSIAFYMVLMNYNVPKVGVGLATSIVVGGQMMTSLAIDHFGLFGLPQASMSLGRFFGFIAVLGGVLLIKFF